MRASLPEAPSSSEGLADMDEEDLVAGGWLLDENEAGNPLWVAEGMDGLCGIVRLQSKDLLRSSHVVTLQVLVHPDGRGQGVGRALVEVALCEARDRDDIEKVVVLVAEDDEALASLIDQAGTWRLERRAPGAFFSMGLPVGADTWALDVGRDQDG